MQGRELICAGRVRVNGRVVRDFLYAVDIKRDKIDVDGARTEKAEWTTFLLHKPRGVVTTRSDEKGRPTVFSMLKEADRVNALHAVGRLDLATSGLLILTNDTQLSSYLTDPQNNIPRTYLVTARGEVTSDDVLAMTSGIRVESEVLRAQKIEIRKSSGRETHLIVELREGKNREIRRLFESIGHEVTKLKRIAFGPLQLGDLKPGEYRSIQRDELVF